MSVVVSVVIPVCLADPTTVSDTLESCLNQTFKDYEILLVDNNAPKNTLMAMEPYVQLHREKVRLVKEPRQGACSARNRGILEAKGQYVALLDDDDMMYSHRLEAQLSAAERHPEAALIHSLFDRASRDNRQILTKGAAGSPEFWRKLLFEPDSRLATVPTVLPSVMFFKRDTAIGAGLFDEEFNPYVAEDCEFCLRMGEQGPFVLVNDALVRHRTDCDADGVARSKRDPFIRIRSLDRLYRALRRRFGSQKTATTERAFQKMRAQWLREASLVLFPYKFGRHRAKYLLRRCLKEDPFDLKTWKVWLRTWYPSPLWPAALHFDEWIHEPLPENLDPQFLESIFSSDPACFHREASG